MSQQLIINILGDNKISTLSVLTACISQYQCNILDSRHALYGHDFSLTMIVSGTQSDITKLEIALSSLSFEHDLLCMMKRTSGHKKQNIGQYVNLEFSGRDASGLMKKVTQALSENDVAVHAVRQKTLEVSNGTQQMLVCKMILSAPKQLDLLGFDKDIKAVLDGLGLHGKISHKPIRENDEYIESW